MNVKYKGISGISENSVKKLKEIQQGTIESMDLLMLSDFFVDLCHTSTKPVVMMIDEVDKAGNYQIFFEFLNLLHNGFLQRSSRPFFQSIILVGVREFKNLKWGIQTDGV